MTIRFSYISKYFGILQLKTGMKYSEGNGVSIPETKFRDTWQFHTEQAKMSSLLLFHHSSKRIKYSKARESFDQKSALILS